MAKNLMQTKSIRKKIQKFAIVSAIITLIFATLNLLEVAPKYNQIFLVIVLISCVLSIVSGLLLYVHPDTD
ncbi:MAG: hypothetical protein P1P90_02310 [Patescibacteria group bacterium]|nr:hypothetical protein [Patescibacteria group bacterium]